jgi:Ca-activated chloride channel family protein
MNDDKFIDNALKEHARHEGNHDQEFLAQLETKLDEHPGVVRVSREKRMRKSASKAVWMSAAALVMLGVTSTVLFRFNQERAEAMVFHETSYPLGESNERQDPDISFSKSERKSDVVRKPSAPSSSADKVTAANASPVAPVFGAPPTSDGIRIDDLEEAGFGHGDGWGDGMVGRNWSETDSGNKYGQLIEQGFLSPLKSPLSTFSIDVDTASYTNIRKLVESGQRIDPNAVRIEEMINYFDYHYAGPIGEHPFAVYTEVAACPWNASHRLVRIGLKGKELEGERKAANLVFLIDVSGSMNSPDKLPLLVRSFEILLRQLGGKDRVSLVVYAGRQAVLLNPTTVNDKGRDAIGRALKNLSAGGSTNGAAGISTAYDLARSGFIEGGVNRVILATDGDFNVGTTNQAELLKLVKNQAVGQISLTILGFGQGNLNDNLMEQLTNHGDGNYFYLDSLREGQKVFQHKLTGTIEIIARDVKIQVEFNPGKVAQYRLIGYANRRLRNQDFANDKIDAGDIGAGHTVTALYEVVPVGAGKITIPGGLKYQKNEEPDPARKIVDSPELLTLKLRYKQPNGDTSTELSEALIDGKNSWREASDDFRFSSAVALWGMLLRNSEHAGEGNLELVEMLALEGRGDDLKGERTGFADLVGKWSLRR